MQCVVLLSLKSSSPGICTSAGLLNKDKMLMSGCSYLILHSISRSKRMCYQYSGLFELQAPWEAAIAAAVQLIDAEDKDVPRSRHRRGRRWVRIFA